MAGFPHRSTPAISRRIWIATNLAAACAFGSDTKGPRGETRESEWKRYSDGSTESVVYRLTDPSYSSTLPRASSRIISRNSALLLYCSDRSGSPQAFRMDLRSGDTQQLTDRKDLDGPSLSLLPDSRSFCYFAGTTLYQVTLANLRERPVCAVADGWDRCSGLHTTSDGAHAIFGERRAGSSRLRSISLLQGAARTIVDVPFELADPIERPLRAQILYRQVGKRLWLVNNDGQQNHELKLTGGGIGRAHWSGDGRTLLYLNFPEDPAQLNTIREYSPDAETDKLVAKTSQYSDFGCNRDTSVFVGASRNTASPVVLIMLRLTRRELTLCEHRASHPEAVAPQFAPDAQRIYFQSDQHGKPALYCVHVERLVERIEGDEK
jgi:oligogalacturonide lyase